MPVRSNNHRRWQVWIWPLSLAAALMALPYGLILIDERIGRLVGTCLLLATFVVGAFWYCVSPKSIIKGGKLSQPENAKKRKVAEAVIRLLALVFGLFTLVRMVIPLSTDVVALARGEAPDTFEATVMRVSTLWGMSGLYQSVQVVPVSDEPQEAHYYWLYCAEPRLKQGSIHEFRVLPHSRFVLEVDVNT